VFDERPVSSFLGYALCPEQKQKGKRGGQYQQAGDFQRDRFDRLDQLEHVQPLVYPVQYPEEGNQPQVPCQFKMAASPWINQYDYPQDKESQTICEICKYGKNGMHSFLFACADCTLPQLIIIIGKYYNLYTKGYIKKWPQFRGHT
jgi:hypothetical protein